MKWSVLCLHCIILQSMACNDPFHWNGIAMSWGLPCYMMLWFHGCVFCVSIMPVLQQAGVYIVMICLYMWWWYTDIQFVSRALAFCFLWNCAADRIEEHRRRERKENRRARKEAKRAASRTDERNGHNALEEVPVVAVSESLHQVYYQETTSESIPDASTNPFHNRLMSTTSTSKRTTYSKAISQPSTYHEDTHLMHNG